MLWWQNKVFSKGHSEGWLLRALQNKVKFRAGGSSSIFFRWCFWTMEEHTSLLDDDLASTEDLLANFWTVCCVKKVLRCLVEVFSAARLQATLPSIFSLKKQSEGGLVPPRVHEQLHSKMKYFWVHDMTRCECANAIWPHAGKCSLRWMVIKTRSVNHTLEYLTVYFGYICHKSVYFHA